MSEDNLSRAAARLREVSDDSHPYAFHRHGAEIARTLVPMVHSVADFLESTRYLFDNNYVEARRFLVLMFASLPRVGLTAAEAGLLHSQLLADACDALRTGPHPEALADD